MSTVTNQQCGTPGLRLRLQRAEPRRGGHGLTGYSRCTSRRFKQLAAPIPSVAGIGSDRSILTLEVSHFCSCFRQARAPASCHIAAKSPVHTLGHHHHHHMTIKRFQIHQRAVPAHGNTTALSPTRPSKLTAKLCSPSTCLKHHARLFRLSSHVCHTRM